jgi:hypothetical protein
VKNKHAAGPPKEGCGVGETKRRKGGVAVNSGSAAKNGLARTALEAAQRWGNSANLIYVSAR